MNISIYPGDGTAPSLKGEEEAKKVISNEMHPEKRGTVLRVLHGSSQILTTF